MTSKIKYIDLCCGMGSFHYSFQKLGFTCVMSCDIFESAKENYQLNYNCKPLGDIYEIEPKNIIDYDILCAGFPCQSFSQAGYHKGFSDTKNKRGNIFFKIMEFIKSNKPKIIILENVPAILTHNKGKTFDTIKSSLENEKYTILYKKLKCSDYGIPQNRKRIFIIAYKNIQTKEIGDFFNLTEFEKKITLSAFFNKKFEKDFSYTIRCGGRRSPINDRHNWDGYIVDGKEYRLTIDDCLKLQGFIDYKLVGTNKDKWKLLGNTIPTIFTKMIGEKIIKHFTF